MGGMHFELAFVLLFVLATAVAIGARWLKVPYTVALVVAGLALGSTHLFEPPHLTRELLFAVILPGLIFEAAFHLEFKKFWAEKLPIHAMAVPGLLISVGVTAVILAPAANALHFVEGFSLSHALVFGAVIAATDPIAVVSLFKALGAPPRLAALIEGESLVNDGTGVVVFTIAVAAVSGAQVTVVSGLGDFVRIAGLGLLVGLAVGWGVGQVIKRLDEPMIELTLTVVAAYGSFAFAEHFHGSGVIATVAAGMTCGSWAARVGMSPTTRIAVETFWEYLAFALNSVVFLLIGFEVNLAALVASWLPILVAYVATVAGRAIVVFAVSAALRPTSARLSWVDAQVVSWAGLRGALSMVLVLSLPRDFPHRELLVHMTFGVVVLSILVQGLSMGWLLSRLGLVGRPSEVQLEWEEQRERARSAAAAAAELVRLRGEGSLPLEVLDALQRELDERKKVAEGALRELHRTQVWLATEDERVARQSLLHAERDSVLRASRSGQLSESVADRLIAEIDLRLQAVPK